MRHVLRPLTTLLLILLFSNPGAAQAQSLEDRAHDIREHLTESQQVLKAQLRREAAPPAHAVRDCL